jgi:hypothetical protein
MSRETDVAWAAGLFEGEGCFSHKGAAASFPRATMALTDLDVLQHFMSVVGVGNMLKNSRKEKPHHKDQWQWYTVGEDEFHAVVKLLRPHLHPRRLAAADKAAVARAAYIAAVTAPRCCANCGEEFEGGFYKSKSRARYCSDKCRFKVRRDRHSARVRAGLAPDREKRPTNNRARDARRAAKRTELQLNRAVFQPQRIKLPEDSE